MFIFQITGGPGQKVSDQPVRKDKASLLPVHVQLRNEMRRLKDFELPNGFAKVKSPVSQKELMEVLSLAKIILDGDSPYDTKALADEASSRIRKKISEREKEKQFYVSKGDSQNPEAIRASKAIELLNSADALLLAQIGSLKRPQMLAKGRLAKIDEKLEEEIAKLNEAHEKEIKSIETRCTDKEKKADYIDKIVAKLVPGLTTFGVIETASRKWWDGVVNWLVEKMPQNPMLQDGAALVGYGIGIALGMAAIFFPYKWLINLAASMRSKVDKEGQVQKGAANSALESKISEAQKKSETNKDAVEATRKQELGAAFDDFKKGLSDLLHASDSDQKSK